MNTKWGTHTVEIGRAFGGTDTNHPFANMELFSLQIYNRALTRSEITLNYEVDKQKLGL